MQIGALKVIDEIEFTVNRVDWQEAKPLLLSVREKVFLIEQRINRKAEQDFRDPKSHHVIVTNEEGHAVGTGRLQNNGHISKLSVLLPFRGKGIGALILKELLDIAQENSFPKVYLNAQLQSQSFYHQHGFKISGPVFMDCGIPHQQMQQLLD